MNNNKTLLLIDPFSSAEFISRHFKANNFRLIVLLTQPSIDSNFTNVDETLFDRVIYANQEAITVDSLLELLQDFDIDYVLNGTEESTSTYDQLCHKLLPQYANNPATSCYRFNKKLMQEGLKQAGLPHIQQCQITPAEFLPQIADGKLPLSFPLFCKPREGYGSINAVKLDGRKELFDFLSGLSRIEQEAYKPYLLQEFIDGEEMIIDSFSVKGKHYLSGVLKYCKISHANYSLYRYIEIESDPKKWASAEEYMHKMLTALEVKNGFTHNEVMFIDNKASHLIELNNRISGTKGSIAEIIKLSGLKSQCQLLSDYLLTGSCTSSTIESITSFARVLVIYKFTSTPIKDPLLKLKSLPSFHKLCMLKDFASKSSLDAWSLLDASAFIILAHPDAEQLLQDSTHIFDLESADALV